VTVHVGRRLPHGPPRSGDWGSTGRSTGPPPSFRDSPLGRSRAANSLSFLPGQEPETEAGGIGDRLKLQIRLGRLSWLRRGIHNPKVECSSLLLEPIDSSLHWMGIVDGLFQSIRMSTGLIWLTSFFIWPQLIGPN